MIQDWAMNINNECKKMRTLRNSDIGIFPRLRNEIFNLHSSALYCDTKEINKKESFNHMVLACIRINQEIEMIESNFGCTFDSDSKIIKFFSNIVNDIADGFCPGCNDEGALFNLIFNGVSGKEIDAFYDEVSNETNLCSM